MPHQFQEDLSCNWMYLTFAFLSLPGWALGANTDPDPGLIDLGGKECEEAHSSCPPGYDLPVIRTKEELDRIYEHYGGSGKLCYYQHVMYGVKTTVFWGLVWHFSIFT